MAIFLDKLRTVDDVVDALNSPLLPKIDLKTEMIDIQRDDAEIAQFERVVGELITSVKQEGYTDYNKAYNNPSIRNLVHQMEQIIANRFGFPSVVIVPDDTFTWWNTAPKHVNNTIVGNINGIVDAWKTDIRDYEAMFREYEESTNDMTMSNPDVMSSNIEEVKALALCRGALDSINAITKELNSFGIVVDRKNAKFKNLPKDYVVYLSCDIVNSVGMTAREFTAVMIHEIGHAFSGLEYTYRSVNNTSVLLDTFLENVQNRNKSVKESLLIAYKTAYSPSDVDQIKDKNTLSLYIHIMTTTFRYTMGSMTPSQIHNNNDDEALADQFAGRFGYGDDLAKGVIKGRVKYHNGIYGSILCAAVISLLVAVAGILIPGLLFVFAFISGVLLGYVLWEGYRIFFEWGEYRWSGYDDFNRRMKRIRNELVRQIRHYKDQPAIVKTILKQIEELDGIEKLANTAIGQNLFNKFRSPISKILDLISSPRRKAISIKHVEQIQEDLNANELYVASAKLKQLKGV